MIREDVALHKLPGIGFVSQSETRARGPAQIVNRRLVEEIPRSLVPRLAALASAECF
jgi:hypothetical protein